MRRGIENHSTAAFRCDATARTFLEACATLSRLSTSGKHSTMSEKNAMSLKCARRRSAPSGGIRATRRLAGRERPHRGRLEPELDRQSDQRLSVHRRQRRGQRAHGPGRAARRLDRRSPSARRPAARQVITEWLRKSVFAPNALATYGTPGRNTFEGPGYANVDLGLAKSFSIIARVAVMFRFEAFSNQRQLREDHQRLRSTHCCSRPCAPPGRSAAL